MTSELTHLVVFGFRAVVIVLHLEKKKEKERHKQQNDKILKRMWYNANNCRNHVSSDLIHSSQFSLILLLCTTDASVFSSDSFQAFILIPLVMISILLLNSNRNMNSMHSVNVFTCGQTDLSQRPVSSTFTFLFIINQTCLLLSSFPHVYLNMLL